jgi:hypothetical protein
VLIAYRYLQSRAQRLTIEMEAAALQIVDRLKGTTGAPAAGGEE